MKSQKETNKTESSEGKICKIYIQGIHFKMMAIQDVTIVQISRITKVTCVHFKIADNASEGDIIKKANSYSNYVNKEFTFIEEEFCSPAHNHKFYADLYMVKENGVNGAYSTIWLSGEGNLNICHFGKVRESTKLIFNRHGKYKEWSQKDFIHSASNDASTNHLKN